MGNADYILPVCIKLVNLHSQCDLHVYAFIKKNIQLSI